MTTPLVRAIQLVSPGACYTTFALFVRPNWITPNPQSNVD